MYQNLLAGSRSFVRATGSHLSRPPVPRCPRRGWTRDDAVRDCGAALRGTIADHHCQVRGRFASSRTEVLGVPREQENKLDSGFSVFSVVFVLSCCVGYRLFFLRAERSSRRSEKGASCGAQRRPEWLTWTSTSMSTMARCGSMGYKTWWFK